MLFSLSFHNFPASVIEARSNTAHSLAGLLWPLIQLKLHWRTSIKNRPAFILFLYIFSLLFSIFFLYTEPSQLIHLCEHCYECDSWQVAGSSGTQRGDDGWQSSLVPLLLNSAQPVIHPGCTITGSHASSRVSVELYLALWEVTHALKDAISLTFAWCLNNVHVTQVKLNMHERRSLLWFCIEKNALSEWNSKRQRKVSYSCTDFLHQS